MKCDFFFPPLWQWHFVRCMQHQLMVLKMFHLRSDWVGWQSSTHHVSHTMFQFLSHLFFLFLVKSDKSCIKKGVLIWQSSQAWVYIYVSCLLGNVWPFLVNHCETDIVTWAFSFPWIFLWIYILITKTTSKVYLLVVPSAPSKPTEMFQLAKNQPLLTN